MTRIAHLTDLHFGAEDREATEALIADVSAFRPDLVAISGDLTMGARRREFSAARRFIDRLGAPALTVPGNHDLTPYRLFERFTRPYARWHSAIAPETEPMWSDDETVVVGLNSARRLGMHWDWSRGRVTASRLARLIARLDSFPRELARVVVTHHPLLPPPGAPRTPVAGGAAAALGTLSRHGVDLVLAGHLHRGYVRSALPGGDPPLILQSATSTSVRLRGEPNAYNRIEIGRSRAPAVHVRTWDAHGWSNRPEPARALP